uniref:Uncharacterized protein n=1 Tax=Solanum lycopersicum TaxID=4081 RepID=A0A3Q7HIH8_SOLLC
MMMYMYIHSLDYCAFEILVLLAGLMPNPKTSISIISSRPLRCPEEECNTIVEKDESSCCWVVLFSDSTEIINKSLSSQIFICVISGDFYFCTIAWKKLEDERK